MNATNHDFDRYPTPTAKDIILARWREKFIKPALDYPKGSHDRGRVVSQLTSKPLTLPSGRVGCVSPPTVYTWINAYETLGFTGLIRKARSDREEYRVCVSREWDGFFASRIAPQMVVRAQDDLNDAIQDFWEEPGASWRIVCRNSTEWLLHRTIALGCADFEVLPLGCFHDGTGAASQYGLCSVNRRRAARDR